MLTETKGYRAVTLGFDLQLHNLGNNCPALFCGNFVQQSRFLDAQGIKLKFRAVVQLVEHVHGEHVERRISALEKSNPDRITMIIHRMVIPGDLDAQAQTVTCHDRVWTREPDETENEMVDRALAEIPRKTSEVVTLIVTP